MRNHKKGVGCFCKSSIIYMKSPCQPDFIISLLGKSEISEKTLSQLTHASLRLHLGCVPWVTCCSALPWWAWMVGSSICSVAGIGCWRTGPCTSPGHRWLTRADTCAWPPTPRAASASASTCTSSVKLGAASTNSTFLLPEAAYVYPLPSCSGLKNPGKCVYLYLFL